MGFEVVQKNVKEIQHLISHAAFNSSNIKG